MAVLSRRPAGHVVVSSGASEAVDDPYAVDRLGHRRRRDRCSAPGAQCRRTSQKHAHGDEQRRVIDLFLKVDTVSSCGPRRHAARGCRRSREEMCREGGIPQHVRVDRAALLQVEARAGQILSRRLRSWLMIASRSHAGGRRLRRVAENKSTAEPTPIAQRLSDLCMAACRAAPASDRCRSRTAPRFRSAPDRSLCSSVFPDDRAENFHERADPP